MQPEENIVKLRLDLVIPNAKQPRKIFDSASLNELASSIEKHGILNPILVRKKDNLYEIIAGERRYRAAKMIGLKEVPVIIKNLDDQNASEIALIENLQRENISPIEEAKSYQEILQLSKITEEELSKTLGKSQAYISNKLRLLKLPQNIQEALINKKISERHARSLISVKDEKKQTELLNRVINEKLTVKELETIINEKEITEAEIKSAIDDIIKSLNISNFDESELNEKKEEKESDNMNNGNFFPNQQPNDQNNTMSLNNMNMQTMNNPQAAPMPSFAMPAEQPMTPAPDAMPAYNPQLEVPTQPQMPTFEMPQTEPQAPATLPTFEMPQPAQSMPVPNVEAPNPIPSFEVNQEPTLIPEPQLVAPVMPETPPVEAANPTPMVDQPLFTAPTTNIPVTEEVAAPAAVPFEVPVDNTQPDELNRIEGILNTNGISYKKYSNETNHCLIIEI